MVDAVPFAVGQTARLETEISPEAEHQAGFGHLYPSLPMQRVDQDGCFLSKTIETSGNQTWTIAGNESRNCGSGQVAR